MDRLKQAAYEERLVFAWCAICKRRAEGWPPGCVSDATKRAAVSASSQPRPLAGPRSGPTSSPGFGRGPSPSFGTKKPQPLAGLRPTRMERARFRYPKSQNAGRTQHPPTAIPPHDPYQINCPGRAHLTWAASSEGMHVEELVSWGRQHHASC